MTRLLWANSGNGLKTRVPRDTCKQEQQRNSVFSTLNGEKLNGHHATLPSGGRQCSVLHLIHSGKIEAAIARTALLTKWAFRNRDLDRALQLTFTSVRSGKCHNAEPNA